MEPLALVSADWQELRGKEEKRLGKTGKASGGDRGSGKQGLCQGLIRDTAAGAISARDSLSGWLLPVPLQPLLSLQTTEQLCFVCSCVECMDS